MQELTIPIEGEPRKVEVAEAPTNRLGRIVWYSVSEQTVAHEVLEDKLAKAGVPREMWPARTRPVDAFKAAVRDVQDKDYVVEYERYHDPQTGALKTDSKTMLIVDRTHDTAIDALPVAMKVAFDPKYQTLTFSAGPRIEQARSKVMEDVIQQRYVVYRESFNAGDIREMIVNAIRASWATVLKKSGGIYFVPEAHTAGVEAIAKVVEDLQDCEMVAVPVIDAEPERRTVLKRYEKATLERIEELMLRVRETVQAGEPIVPSEYKRVLDELEYLREQKEKYEELLDTAMGKVDVEMQVLASELLKLGDLVKEK